MRGPLANRKARESGIPPSETGGDPRSAILVLLERRGAGSTICPSEAARAVAAAAGKSGWRGEMPAVNAAVDSLVADGLVRLSWKGAAMAVRDGPYRIGRA